MGINVLKLKYFHAVAAEGSFTRAAQALRVAQPSLSKMVRELEEELGFPLLERSTRHVGLTSQGEKVFAHASRVFEEVGTLEKSLGEIARKVTGPLAFGTSDLVAAELVPPVLTGLLQQHPSLYPVVQTGTAQSLVSMVLERRLEFALLFHVPESLHDGIELTRFAPVPFELVVAKSKAKDKRVLESFMGSREVDDQATKRFPTMEKWRKVHPGTSIRISTNCLAAHLSLVREGAGVAVLPRFLVAEDLRKGKLVALLKEELVFDLKLLSRKNSSPSLNARTFLEALRGHLSR